MNRILLSSVCSKSVVYFIQSVMVVDTLSNCEGCLIRPSEAAKPHSPTLPYSELATALVKLQCSFQLTVNSYSLVSMFG